MASMPFWTVRKLETWPCRSCPAHRSASRSGSENRPVRSTPWCRVHRADEPGLGGNRTRDGDRVDRVRSCPGRPGEDGPIRDRPRGASRDRRAAVSTDRPVGVRSSDHWTWDDQEPRREVDASPGTRPSAEGNVSEALASASTWIRHPFPRRLSRPSVPVHSSNVNQDLSLCRLSVDR